MFQRLDMLVCYCVCQLATDEKRRVVGSFFTTIDVHGQQISKILPTSEGSKCVPLIGSCKAKIRRSSKSADKASWYWWTRVYGSFSSLKATNSNRSSFGDLSPLWKVGTTGTSKRALIVLLIG